jgi:drug/metabolite transporter (DMT)-like permease
MNFEWYFLLPLSAGFIYALSTLFVKRASASNVGLTRTLCLSNWMMGVLFLFVFLFHQGPVNWELWYAPLLAGFCFFLGQVFTFVAIRIGDVSVMTPVMGTKVVFVALAALVLTAEPPPPLVWGGAILTAIAIFALGVGDFRSNRAVLPAIAAALASAAFFGLTDSLVQKWGRSMGPQFFIGAMFSCVALMSFGLIPFFRGSLRSINRWAWPWLLAGTFLMALQALLLGLALSNFGAATEMNILYSSRGIWSIILVITVGPYFANLEREAGIRVMILRLVGAVLLTAAIGLVLLADS